MRTNLRCRLGFFIVISLSLFIAGCWDLGEIDRRSFAATIGLDQADGGGVEMSVQVPLPQRMLPPDAGGAQQGKKFSTISAAGRTVNDAFNVLQTKTYRELVIQQNKSIVFSSEIARRGIRPHLDFFLRAPKAPPQSLVFVARGQRSAGEILALAPAQETLPSLQFIEAAESKLKYDRTYYIPAWRFGQMLVDDGWDAYAPLIDIDPAERVYVTAGLAVFSGNRMAGELDQHEAQLFGMVANKIKAGGLTVDLPGGGLFTLRNVRADTRIEALRSGDAPAFRVRVRLRAASDELTSMHIGNTPAYNRRLECAAIAWLQPRIARMLGKLQRLNADIAGFGAVLRARRQDLWRRIDWKEVFPTAPIEVKVEAAIARNGVFR